MLTKCAWGFSRIVQQSSRKPTNARRNEFCDDLTSTLYGESRNLKEQSMFWTRIWRECGYPSSGVVSVIRKKAKAKYKYPARRLLRCQNHLIKKREVLAEALCSDSSRDFWTEVNCFERWSTRGTSGVVDGTSRSASIADLWAGKFEAF